MPEMITWLLLLSTAAGFGPAARKHNILMIVVDDLRPQMKVYGEEYMHTPNIDALAAESVLFERAYVQQAICSPTRNSFMSGRYPEKTLTWNFLDDFRTTPDDGEDWIALPQFFRDHGWFTTGAGKVYHGGHPANFDQDKSWSEKWGGEFGGCSCGGRTHPWPPEGHATCEGVPPAPCGDDTIVSEVVSKLEMAANGTLGNGTQPFLIAAGLHKPHVPFYAPQKYFALYPDPTPPFPLLPPTGMPYAAYHSCLSRVDGANYSDWGNFTDIPNTMTQTKPMEPATAAHLRRGYFASVSYTDANVGMIMSAAKPLLDSTVVVLVGDHGWSLGEGNEWCKMTNFENGVRVPFIWKAPGGHAGMRTWKLAEAVDMYKTLADLSGIGADKVEAGVDGVSLASIIVGPEAAAPPRNVSRSVFPRCYPNATAYAWNASVLPTFDRTDCQDIPKEHFDIMGYSIRTDKYRYTEWRKWDGAALRAIWTLPPNGTELYMHATDGPAAGTQIGFSSELVNSAVDPRNAPLLAKMSKLLRHTFGIADGAM